MLVVSSFLYVGAAAAADTRPEPMNLMSSEPRPREVMSGSGVAFSLVFDHPIDHQHSSFTLTAANGRKRVIPVRLDAQPSALYASVGRLPAGSYVLEWVARAANGAMLSGTIPFDVGS
jgi:methionine-rich copper-binding protein CopC